MAASWPIELLVIGAGEAFSSTCWMRDHGAGVSGTALSPGACAPCVCGAWTLLLSLLWRCLVMQEVILNHPLATHRSLLPAPRENTRQELVLFCHVAEALYRCRPFSLTGRGSPQ